MGGIKEVIGLREKVEGGVFVDCVDRAYYKSPIGVLEIVGDDRGIREINFCEGDKEGSEGVPESLEEAWRQIDEYFCGKRKVFDLKMVIEGTEFQNKVWRALMDIPYGEVATYKDIAVAINNEKAVRAVGNANHNNKIPIVIPCHRVIGANGKLVGYAGELWRKEWLIGHEKNML